EAHVPAGAHRQGQGSVVHGGRLQLALARSDRRRAIGRPPRAGRRGGVSTSMRDAFAEALVRAAAIDPTIVVLDGDVANSTKTDRFHQALPRQFVHAGIAEQNIVGVAAGLASVGFRPFVTTFAVFATSRAHDQVRMVVAQTGLNVKIVGAYSGLLTGKTGKTHICV